MNEKGFDSILVRLKVMNTAQPLWVFQNICFDSILVRLKVSLIRLMFKLIHVSIPYWFD